MSKLLSIVLIASMITRLQAMENPILNPSQETDEEFIARAKEKCGFVAAKRCAKAIVSDGWWDQFNVESYWLDQNIALASSCSPLNVGAVTIVLTDSQKQPQLQDTLIRANSLLARFTRATKHTTVKHIALSSGARFLALFKDPLIGNSEEIWPFRDYFITVYDIESEGYAKEVRRFNIPSSFGLVAGLEFNTQASKLIIVGRDYTKYHGGYKASECYSTEHHIIFELNSASTLP